MSEYEAPKGFRFLYSKQADKFKIQVRFLWFWVDLDTEGRVFTTISQCQDYLKEYILPRDWKALK